MVVITETSDAGLAQHGPYQGGTGDHGTTNLLQIFAGTTKFVTEATTPNEAVHGVELALEHAAAGRPGPAAVIVRGAGMLGEADPAGMPRLYDMGRVRERSRPAPAEEDVRRVAELLAAARWPVIIAGNGVNVARAHGALAEVARAAGVAVVTTTRGRAAIAGDDPWCAGPIGIYGDAAANHAVAEADVVLVLGSRLNPNDTLYETTWFLDPKRQQIVQVDVEARHLGWTIPVEVGVVADAGAFLERLAAALAPDAERVARRAARLADLRREKRDDAPELHESRVPIPPQRICGLINENLPFEERVVLDAGNNRIFMQHFYRSRQAANTFLPGGVAGMGWGPCAAVAAGIIDPARRTVCVAGDGGMFMSIHVLSSAIEHGTPVTFVVMNNGGLGSIRDAQRERPVASTFPATDFAAVARAFGVEGRRVERDAEFVEALKESSDLGGPILLDVLVDPNEPYTKVLQRDPTRKRKAKSPEEA
jgi:acetolactate synthase-1/2/3 large subunit